MPYTVVCRCNYKLSINRRLVLLFWVQLSIKRLLYANNFTFIGICLLSRWCCVYLFICFFTESEFGHPTPRRLFWFKGRFCYLSIRISGSASLKGREKGKAHRSPSLSNSRNPPPPLKKVTGSTGYRQQRAISKCHDDFLFPSMFTDAQKNWALQLKRRINRPKWNAEAVESIRLILISHLS